MAGLILISIICISCAFLLWFIADKRGANSKFWAIMGAVFGPLAIPFVFLTKDKSSKPDRSNQLWDWWYLQSVFTSITSIYPTSPEFYDIKSLQNVFATGSDFWRTTTSWYRLNLRTAPCDSYGVVFLTFLVTTILTSLAPWTLASHCFVITVCEHNVENFVSKLLCLNRNYN